MVYKLTKKKSVKGNFFYELKWKPYPKLKVTQFVTGLTIEDVFKQLNVNSKKMKIKKTWLVMQNNYFVQLVKTKCNRYFYFEETNKCGFIEITKKNAKELIKKAKNEI